MLTPRQTEILEYIRRFIEREGWAPTTREIATYFGIGQNAAVQHLRSLEDRKAIARGKGTPRAIKILEAA